MGQQKKNVFSKSLFVSKMCSSQPVPTTDRNKGKRTTAVTMGVDLGHLRAARIALSENPGFVKIEPKSQPVLADQPAALSEPIAPCPSEALGRRVALIIRHQSS